MQPSVRDAAKLLRTRLVRGGAGPATFRAALESVPARERDAWLDLLWDCDELPEDDPILPRGCVPYLPCPVASVLAAVQRGAVTRDDVFVDIGSGLGRTAFLVHLLTGAGCVGLEIQPELVRAARGRAAWLGLERTRFLEGDATELVRTMNVGTVFFLYCPFSGERLHRVLDELEIIARTRAIRICGVDLPPIRRPWLTEVGSGSMEVAVYRSTAHWGERDG